MKQLELQQRGLLNLIKGRLTPLDDPYLQRVAGSRELAMVREIAVWWRMFGLEAQCRFTSSLLKRLGCFEALVMNYFDNNATSPFIEELSRDFLSSLCAHQDRLIRAISQFEYGFLKARAGSVEAFEILWDRNPDLVFVALKNDTELPAPEQGCLYRMQIARHLPNMVACTREFTP